MPASCYAFGEILLAALAFSDAGGAKRRPVLVIHDFGDDDLLVAPVTSHTPRGVCDVYLADWSAGGLRLPSVVRMEKLATVAKSCILRKLGALSACDRTTTQQQLESVLQQIASTACKPKQDSRPPTTDH